MDQRHTLFIIGAGASFDFGLPVGDELARLIGDRAEGLLKGDSTRLGTTADWLYRRYPAEADREPKMRALQKIAERIYPAASIDRLIDQNDHDEHIKEMGKVLIATCIAEAEGAGELQLQENRKIDLQKKEIARSWCDVFLKLLVKGEKWTRVDELLGRNYSVICFNYDRCVERYLISGLQQAFGHSYRGAWQLVYEKLNIIHPYGQLGRLPSSSEKGNDGVRFGTAQADPWDMAQEIRTFTEQDFDQQKKAAIRKTVDKADRVVFLGFSFEQLNMEVMEIFPSKRRQVFASAFGIQKTEEDELALRIRQMLGVSRSDAAHTSVKLAFDRDCKQTLNDFYYELTSYLN